jgi:hypothetical protein
VLPTWVTGWSPWRSTRTGEHLEWIADEVRQAGGEATLRLATPTAAAQDRA